MTDLLALVDWKSAEALIGVAGVVAAAMLWLTRQMMRRDFATRQEHQVLSNRLTRVENRLETTATHDDVKALGADVQRVAGRLQEVETSVAVAYSDIRAVRESQTRTEHMVGLVLEHMLTKERAQ